MAESSTRPVLHYTYWGAGPKPACGTPDHVIMVVRHESITCPDCKATQVYRDHVIQRELAFDGNFSDWNDAMRRKAMKYTAQE